MTTETHRRLTAAERRRAAENAIASARLEGLDPSSLQQAIDGYVRGTLTIDGLLAQALASGDDADRAA